MKIFTKLLHNTKKIVRIIQKPSISKINFIYAFSIFAKRVILFYISDQGSFLGEEGKFFHGNSSDFMNQAHKVPMLMWMSNALLKEDFYQKKFNNASLKINQPISHDNLFHSILDCSGIESTVINQNLTICQ